MDKLQVSSASVDITPEFSMNLSGYGQTESFKSIYSNLELNGVLFIQGSFKILMLSADTLFVSNYFLDVLEEKFSCLGLRKENILFGSSHTHYAPSVDPSKPKLGLSDKNYISFFEKKLIYLCGHLLSKKPNTCKIVVSTGNSNITVNRRRFGFNIKSFSFKKEIIRAPNFKGVRDTTIYLFKFLDKYGNLQAILWSYSAHPIEVFNSNELSANYVGEVRKTLRSKLNNPLLSVVFFQGFSGNLKPYSSYRKFSFNSLIKRFVQGRYFFSPLSYKGYTKLCDDLCHDVLQTYDQKALTIIPIKLNIGSITLLMSNYIESDYPVPKLIIHVLKISPSLVMIAISAEVVSEYYYLIKNALKKTLPDLKLMIPFGCMGSVFGYLPTDQLIYNGGYESEGFFQGFSLSGKYRKNIEDHIVDQICRLTESLYK